MQLLIEKSRRLYNKLKWAVDRENYDWYDPYDFRLLDNIHFLYQNTKLQQPINDILEIGDEMCKLIKEKGGLIEGGITQIFIEYEGHLSILKSAKETDKKDDWEPGWQEFGYYPRMLNREVKEGYKVVKEHYEMYLNSGDKLIAKAFKVKYENFYNFKKKEVFMQTVKFYDKTSENYKKKI